MLESLRFYCINFIFQNEKEQLLSINVWLRLVSSFIIFWGLLYCNSFCDCLIAFVCPYFWCWDLDGDLIVSVSDLTHLLSSNRQFGQNLFQFKGRLLDIVSGADSVGLRRGCSVESSFDWKFHFHGKFWINLIKLGHFSLYFSTTSPLYHLWICLNLLDECQTV